MQNERSDILMTTPRKRVLITGATGRIGQLVAERLGDTYEFSGLARRSSSIPTHIADVTDLEGMLPAFEGINAVVHMAADPSPTAEWESVYASNIGGTYNVLEASRRSGVDAVIFASSNHAHGWWEMDNGPEVYAANAGRILGPDDPYQPDSLYGWSKAAGEALGRFYSDVHGLRIFNLRIGWVMDADDPMQASISNQLVPPLDETAGRARACAIWLSNRDCVELIRCCLEADHIRYGVYYGISDNAGKFYDLTNAREEIGYIPQDGAPVP
jgi:NAD+ dependent glucose-6-phosphate dehydrogenase